MLPRANRIRYEEVEGDLISSYKTNEMRNLREINYRLDHLRPFFAGRRLMSIGPADAAAYAQRRRLELDAKRKPPNNATINRELGLLVRLLRLAEGCLVYLMSELQGLLRGQVARVMALMRERGAVIPYLFPHLRGRHQGKHQQDLRKTRAVFDRYHIVSPADLQEATRKLAGTFGHSGLDAKVEAV